MNKADDIKRLAVFYAEADIQHSLNGETDEDFERLVAARKELHAAIDEMQAEIDRLTKDVERYRWLRAGKYSIQLAQSILNDTPNGIDESIDAAMAGKKRGDKTEARKMASLRVAAEVGRRMK